MKKVETVVLDIVEADRADAKEWPSRTITWSELIDWVEHPASVKECGGYVLGKFRGLRRVSRELVHRGALTLDVDHGWSGVPEAAMRLGWAVLWHSTYRSAPDQPRYRFIFPLSRPVTGAEYEIIAEHVAHRLGAEHFDRSSFRPNQFMWKPAHQRPEWYEHGRRDGVLLPVTQMLAEPLPELARPAPRRLRKKDPLLLNGAVGAFNRAHPDLDELIASYALPYDKVGDDLWRFRGSVSQPGMGPIQGADSLWYSHHGTDPACGQAVSAFDLVRIHLHGDADEGCSEDTPVNRLPSYGAMMETALADPATRSLQAADLFGDDGEGGESVPSPGRDWLMELELDKNSKVKDTVGNKDLILENDPFFQRLVFDIRRYARMVGLDPLPWEKRPRWDEGLSEADEANAKAYIERTYRMKLSKSETVDLIARAANSRWFDPVEDMLLSLEWDGIERIETCLPVAVHGPFERLAARMAVFGAVARALTPGCKTDFTLVLVGSEGLGKTRWVETMGLSPEWTVELKDIKNKDTWIDMSRAWIAYSDELSNMRRAEAEDLKSFLTRTHDNFRKPFERESKPQPRRAVVWATTNDAEFLRRQEGNRRFLPVRVVSDPSKLEPEYVRQVWAEAVAKYRDHPNPNELLYMSRAEEALARQHREGFTLEEPLVGQVAAYLAMTVPGDWDVCSLDFRREWWTSLRFSEPEKIEDPRVQTEVCAQAIWAEVLEGRGPIPERTAREITDALASQPDWVPGGVRQTRYGLQRVVVYRPGFM